MDEILKNLLDFMKRWLEACFKSSPHVRRARRHGLGDGGLEERYPEAFQVGSAKTKTQALCGDFEGLPVVRGRDLDLGFEAVSVKDDRLL